MTKNISPSPYKGYRFPPVIISHGVWLYFRFSLSFRDVEELMAERRVMLTYETVRQWCHNFGQTYVNGLKCCRARPGDTWHLDEVFLKINGEQYSLWRAVDQHGNILDILVQSKRNKDAAKKCFRKLLKGLQYVSCVIDAILPPIPIKLLRSSSPRDSLSNNLQALRSAVSVLDSRLYIHYTRDQDDVVYTLY